MTPTSTGVVPDDTASRLGLEIPTVAITDPPSPYSAYCRAERILAGVRVEVGVGAEAVMDLIPDILATGRTNADIETMGLGADRWRIKAVGLADRTGTKVAILDPRDPRDARLLRDTFTRSVEIALHNASFDAPPLVHTGLMAIDDLDKVVDTLVLARMGAPGQPAGLDAVASRVLGLPKSASPWTGLAGAWTAATWYRRADLGMARYIDGLAADVSVTARLVDPLVERIRALYAKAPWWGRGEGGFRRVLVREIEVSRMWLRRSTLGLPVDSDYAAAWRDRYEVEIEARRSRLEQTGITSTNPATMVRWLTAAGVADHRWPRTSTGAISAAKPALVAVASVHRPIADYLTVRGADRVCSYLDAMEAEASITGRVSPTINVYGAKTGRMSISNPPLQQFSPAARGILLSPYPHGLASIDWSAVEVVVAAILGRDAGMLDYIARGEDVYKLAVDAGNIERDSAKNVVLADLYGRGLRSLSRKLGIDSAAAEALRDKVRQHMPGVTEFAEKTKRLAETGYVATLDGRTVPIDRDPKGRLRAYAGTNFVCQGTAYALLAEALVEVRRRGLQDHVLLPVHDELVVDADPTVTAEISEIMSTPPDFVREHLAGLPVRLAADPERIPGGRWGKPGKPTDLKTFDVAADVDELLSEA